MSRLAVVLFNLGGPDRPEAVEPFLFNLFNDPAIIGAPRPIRWLIAKLISRRRAPVARVIYAQLGGGSPLVPLTRKQGVALEARLKHDGTDARVFIAMRYWRPFSDETAREVAAFAPDRIVLLPLYPQFSTTTTESSLKDWMRAARAAGLEAPTHAVCCYPDEDGFIAAQVELTAAALVAASRAGSPRVLFSAHGLPKKTIAKGDPYQRQVETTAAAIARKMGLGAADWVVCYQSRVGPLEWIGPSTTSEIERAGRDRVPVVVAPIAFVSEHSETLVELDIEYRRKAEAAGVPAYARVPAVAEHPRFIEGLARRVRAAVAQPAGTCGTGGGKICGQIHAGESARCAYGRALDRL